MKHITSVTALIPGCHLFHGEFTTFHTVDEETASDYCPDYEPEHPDTNYILTAEDCECVDDEGRERFGFVHRTDGSGYMVIKRLPGINRVHGASADPLTALLAAIHEQSVNDYNYELTEVMEVVGAVDSEERTARLKELYADKLAAAQEIVAQIEEVSQLPRG